jgi:hypothetical protein
MARYSPQSGLAALRRFVLRPGVPLMTKGLARRAKPIEIWGDIAA